MLLRFLAGILLVAGSLALASAEAYVRSFDGIDGVVISASEVWYALSPKTYTLTRHWISETLSPALWNPVLLGVLWLPGWLLAGVPGAALIWWSRTKAETPDEIAEEESLLLYDELAKRAREEGHHEGADDLLPHHVVVNADGHLQDARPHDAAAPPHGAVESGDTDMAEVKDAPPRLTDVAPTSQQLRNPLARPKPTPPPDNDD